MNNLAERAVACAGWRWMPRMVNTDGTTHLGGDVWAYPDTETIADGCGCLDDTLPDLTDPATLGCLLALVREAAGEPGLTASRVGTLWRMTLGHGLWEPLVDDLGMSRKYPTEAEALVAALEAAS